MAPENVLSRKMSKFNGTFYWKTAVHQPCHLHSDRLVIEYLNGTSSSSCPTEDFEFQRNLIRAEDEESRRSSQLGQPLRRPRQCQGRGATAQGRGQGKGSRPSYCGAVMSSISSFILDGLVQHWRPRSLILDCLIQRRDVTS